MSIQSKLVVLALSAVLSLSVEVQATSAKALGMGNAAVAYPQDSLSTAYNPALAVYLGNRGDFWISSNFSPYDARISQNRFSGGDLHASGRRTWTPSAAIGSISRVCSNVSVGFIFYNRFCQKTHFNKHSELLGTTSFGRGYEQYCGSAIAAISLDSHQLGLSLDILAGRHKVSGLQSLDHRRFTESPGRFTNRGYDWNYGLGLTIGWHWMVTPEFEIGVSFRPETKMSRFHRYKGFIPEHGVFHNPQKALAGFAWRMLPCTTLAFDVEYIWVRRLRAEKNPGDHMTHKWGSKHGPALGLNNDLILHVGLDYALTPEIVLRTGYIYEREIQNKCQAFWDMLYCSPIQHYLTLGATYAWKDCIEFDIFYQHGFERSIKGPHAVPTLLGGGEARMRRSLDRFGVGVGIAF
ncbi:MAG: hypothetical protein LLG04_01680 [Parachlamydia sp.]|nr:hypothetical protein [Parachlamydia sp.]